MDDESEPLGVRKVLVRVDARVRRWMGWNNQHRIPCHKTSHARQNLYTDRYPYQGNMRRGEHQPCIKREGKPHETQK